MSSAGIMDIAAARLTIARLPELLRHVGNWWLNEFLSLLPERMADFLAGKQQASLVLALDAESMRFELLGRHFETVDSGPASHLDRLTGEIEAFLRARSFEREAVQFGLRLPASKVFSRELLLPAEAVHVLESVVAQDMARRTPFRADAVFADHAIVERIGNRVKVAQWIVRREDVRNALAPSNIALEQVAFIAFEYAEASASKPIIRLGRPTDARSASLRKAILVACGVGALLAAAACGLKYWNQQTTLDRLETEISTMSKKAQQVRGMVDQLQEKKVALGRLRMQRNDVPRLIDIWDEVTRVLPPHSWLTELKVAETAGRETQVNLLGFSSTAPSLVGVIDRSPMFVDAALSAPVALDPTEGRERFALQAKVRRPDLVKGEGR